MHYRELDGYNSSRHHILETRKDWESNSQASKLRHTHELIPRIDQDAHDSLTLNCPIVPLLGYKALDIVVADFKPGVGTLDSIDKLLISINKVTQTKSIHKIERELAELAMQSIELQIPFIKGNIIPDER